MLSTLLLFVVLGRAEAGESRVWTNTADQKMKASLIDCRGEDAVFLSADGNLYAATIESLCESDRAYIAGLSPGEKRAEESIAGLRKWLDYRGNAIQASLVRADGERVWLKLAEDKVVSVRMDELSLKDRALLERLSAPRGNERIEGIDARPGVPSGAIACRAAPKWSYHLYLPKRFHDARRWPVWFIMSPGGGGRGQLKRYIKGADRLGCIVAVSVQSKNRFGDSDLAMAAMVEDVYERIPVKKRLSFASGFSGGSRMAYLLAERNNNIQGVLACGSGSGVYLKETDFREARLRRSTYIYSLIGTNCFNRSEAYQSHQEMPDDFRLRFFPGGHAWAGADLIAEGMARVLGEALKSDRDRAFKDARADYSRAVWTMTREMREKVPWEAHRWALFLAEFPGDTTVRSRARALARELAAKPKVRLAQEAEEDIEEFAEDFFDGVHHKEDRKPNEDRAEAAERIAEKYESIPHGTIIRRLGDKS